MEISQQYIDIAIGFFIGVFLTLILSQFKRKKSVDKNETMVYITNELKEGHDALKCVEEKLRRFYKLFRGMVK
jgi:hypothetical protein